METGKVKLTSPAKISGKKHAAGSTVEVTSAEALQLADAGAIEITPTDHAKLRELVSGQADIAELSTEQLEPVVELIRADTAGELKTAAGNWSLAKISKALGRDVSQAEVDKAAFIAVPQA